MKVWKIEGWNGAEREFELAVPNGHERPAIIRILERLVCRHLSPQEVVEASIARDHEQHNALLEPVSQSVESVHFGHGERYYIATLRPMQ